MFAQHSLSPLCLFRFFFFFSCFHNWVRGSFLAMGTKPWAIGTRERRGKYVEEEEEEEEEIRKKSFANASRFISNSTTARANMARHVAPRDEVSGGVLVVCVVVGFFLFLRESH